MRRLAILVATVAMLSIPPAASAAPPADRVLILDLTRDVGCDGSSLTFNTTGWVTARPTPATLVLPPDPGVLERRRGELDIHRHRPVRFIERDGVPYNTLSGRSINVGPDDSSWIGHWVLNMETDEASRAGRGLGYIDELACSMLT